jgi:hypothetical protein
VAADGHGIWTHTSIDGFVWEVPFFVEIDLSTEDLPRLARKIGAYEKWARATGNVWPVLFWLTSTTRETHLQDRLHAQPLSVPVATGVASRTHLPGTGPAYAVWWLHRAGHWLGHTGAGRLTLADLAGTVTNRPHLDNARPTPRSHPE